MKMTANKQVAIKWLSETDLLSDDYEADFASKNAWYIKELYIQNPDNTKTLEDLKRDKEAIQLLADLQKTNAVEINVYQDDRHESFNIQVFFEDEESCEACTTAFGGDFYGVPTGDIFRQLKMVQKKETTE